MTRRPRSRAAALALLLAAAPLAPLAAQQAGPAPEAPPAENGDRPLAERLGEAARQAIEELERELGPLLENALDALGKLDDYGAPRVLENGDILIPRKPDAPPPGQAPAPDSPGENGGNGEPETLDL
ncbi:MAG: hypothetical protein ACQEUZ_11055 [Pseudomonadota bacterium]